MLLILGLAIFAVVAVIIFQLRPGADGAEKALLRKPLVAPVIAVTLTTAIATGIIFSLTGLSTVTG